MKKLFVFLAHVFFVCYAHAGLETYFKPIHDKPNDPIQLSNVDYIYMINLDQRPEKYAHCLAELAPYGITPYRFSAVNGWQLSSEVLNKIGVKFHPCMPMSLEGVCFLPETNYQGHHETLHFVGRNYFSHHMSRGTIGIVLSHLSVLKDAYDSGYETIWVMEDDIQVIQDPHKLSALIEELDITVGKSKWDILFTDQDTKDSSGNYIPCLAYAERPDCIYWKPERFLKRKDVSNQFRRIGARYGAYSMIVRRSGMKKLLDFYKEHPIFLPYDLEYILPDDMRLYTVKEDVVSTVPGALSDNGAPNYKNKEKTMYDNYQENATSHYESQAEASRLQIIQAEQAKHDAFIAMDQLTGWCTKFKASVLIDLIVKNQAKKVVEIGVWGGSSLIPMAYALRPIGGKIIGIDPWKNANSAQGMTGANQAWWSKVDHEKIYRDLKKSITKFSLNSQIQLVRSSSEDAPEVLDIDLLHIDGNHSEEKSVADVLKWVPLVKSGGIIVFDDTTWDTTAKAVQWLNANCIKGEDYHETNDWGIWIKP